MADSLRGTQGSQTLYRNTAIDAALGREAHREQTGAARATRVSGNAPTAPSYVAGAREAQAETLVSAIPREAHLETIGATAPRATVSVTALQRLGGLLRRDENLARKLAKNPQRALAALDFISDRDKQVLAGINPQFWSQVAAVSDDFQGAKSKRAMAGLAEAPLSIDGGTGFGSGGSTPYDWGDIGPPQGRGVNVGNGFVVHPGGRGQSPQGVEGDDGGGLGVTPDYGFGRGDAGDPRIGGHDFGARTAGGGGGSRFSDPLGYTAIGVHGDGGGISGGGLPSRAVLAGSRWRGLYPGRDVSDDDSTNKPDAGAPEAGAGSGTGTRQMPEAGPDAMTGSYTPATPSMTGGEIAMMTLGGVIGTALGGWAGSQVPLVPEAAAVGLGISGAVGLGYVGYRIAHHFGWMPADDGFGGTGGGPRSQVFNRFAGAQDAGRFIPADDGTGASGGNGRGPRSNVYMPGVYVPADDGYGGTGGGPRSIGGVLTPSTMGAHAVRTARSRPDSP